MKKLDRTRITLSFRSRNQAPWFMIIKEYYENGEIVFAEVLFQVWPTANRWFNKHKKSLLK